VRCGWFPASLGPDVELVVNRLSLLALAVALSLLIVAGLSTPVRAEPPPFGVATAVWGQSNFVSRTCHSASVADVCGPAQTAVDAQGNLWVADFDHNRVLLYPSGRTTATEVFGQYGSFTSAGCNRRPPAGSHLPPAPSRYTLCEPFGVAVDARGTLYVGDSINNRVLVYFHAAHKPPAAPADLVLGQPTFASTASNDVPAGGKGIFHCPAPHPASRCTVSGAMGLSLDAAGDLLVADLDNNRVLLWSRAVLARAKPGSCTKECFIPAARVWGQYGSFTSNAANNPAVLSSAAAHCTAITFFTPASACTLSNPSSAIADANGNLFIADTSNNRVLEYDGALATGRQDATAVYGQNHSFVSVRADSGGISASSLAHPIGLAIGPGGHLWVSDFRHMRVLDFPTPGSSAASIAVQVLGQRGSFETDGCAALADALCGPTSITFDSHGDAFVADGLNNRVLEYDAPSSPG
jgi:hypothetical protein